MNITGIILAEGKTMPLTEKRAAGALPFAGRYRQVDFALSNLSYAGVRQVGLVARKNYQSLIHHVGSGEEWGLQMAEGGLSYLTPFATEPTAVMDFLDCGDPRGLVALVDGSVVCNLDLQKIVTAHLRSGKDITRVEKDGKSVGIYLMKKSRLIQLLRGKAAPGTEHIFDYRGLVLRNRTVEEYFRNSLRLTEGGVQRELFGGCHPVYTRVRDRVPTYYGEDCRLENCSVADGCRLEGTVKNGVLFRNVTVQPGAQVENCVILNDTVVGEKAILKNVILDKDVVVRPGACLMGTADAPVYLGRGAVV